MTRVPNIRDYEGFAEGVNWTEALSLKTMLDFINSETKTPISSRLIDWLTKNHEGFAGYNDDKFDGINLKAFEDLLQLSVESQELLPTYNRIVGEEETQTLDSLIGGAVATKYTLQDLIEGKADDYALEYEDTPDNKKILGSLLGEQIIREGRNPAKYIESIVQAAIKRKIFSDDSDVEERFLKIFKDQQFAEGFISVFAAVVSNLKQGIVAHDTDLTEAYIEGAGTQIAFADYIKSVLPETYGGQRMGGLMIPTYRDAEDKSLSQEDYLEKLLSLSKIKLINLVNRVLKRIGESKLESTGISADIIQSIRREVDSQINNSIISEAVITPTEAYKEGQVGRYAGEISEQQLINWFKENKSDELTKFINWLNNGIQNTFSTEYTYTDNNWNPLKIADIKGSQREYKRQNTFKGKVFLTDSRRKESSLDLLTKVGELIATRDEFEASEKGKASPKEQLESAFEQGNELDATVELFNAVDDQLKSKENMYEVADDERLFPDISTIREKRLLDSVLNNNKDEFVELLETAIEELGKLSADIPKKEKEEEEEEPLVQDDQLRVSSEMYEEAQQIIDALKKLKRLTNIVPDKILIAQYTDDVIRILSEQGRDEEASIVREAGSLNNLTDDEFYEISGLEIRGENTANTIVIIRSLFGEGITHYRDIVVDDLDTAAKLLFFPILYGDETLSDFAKETEIAQPLKIAYNGKLEINLDFTSKGLSGKYSFTTKNEIKPELGTRATNFSVKQGASRVGQTGFAPSGQKVLDFDSVFNEKKNRYLTDILKKLIRLQMAVRGD